jgi:hypothetical protein
MSAVVSSPGTLRAGSALRPAWTDLAAGLLALALWLCARPYRGIRHDAILYAGQILNRLYPERFASDPFFMHGSQDRWSLFSPLMAPLVEHFGFAVPEMAGLVLCQLAFAIVCWHLARDWPSRALRWAAVCAVLVLPHTYGGLGEFGYAEPFFSARSLAEPFALGALLFLMRGRLGLALASAAGALAFHPLIAVPILLVGWIWLILGRRAWAWLGLALVLPALVGAAGVAPFQALWQRFDATWMQGVSLANDNAFIATYNVLDWMPVVFDAIVLWLFVRAAPTEPLRRLAKAVLLAVPLATLAWGLGADVFHDVLLTQLQLWRIYWPMHLLSMMALPLVVLQCWRRDAAGRWAASALCLAGLAVMSNWPTGWLCVAWAALSLAAARARAPVAPAISRLAVVASGLAMVAISAKVLRVSLTAVAVSQQRFDDIGAAPVVLSLPFVAGMLAAGLLALMHRRGGLVPAAVVAGILLAFGAMTWDERSAWERELEAGPPGGKPLFDDVLPAGASAFWQGDEVLPVWLLARRGDFYSQTQGAGLLFNRSTSLTFMQRRAVMSPFELQQGLCTEINLLTKASSATNDCVATPEVADEVCAKPGHPDFLVLTAPLDSRPAAAQWHPPAVIAARGAPSFYLYRCGGPTEAGPPAPTIKP